MFEIHLLSDGTFKLDGGAMHGVVPMALWRKLNPPDEKNRILLSVNSLFIRSGDEKILIEPGIGVGHPEKFAEIFCVEKKRSILGDLKSIGVRPEEITTVIPTHLHFDHAGGVADWKTGALLFPNAKFLIQKEEWEASMQAHPKNRDSYLPEFLEPLKKGKLEFVGGEKEVFPGVRVVHTGGHTHGHQAVFVEAGGRTFAFLGDLVPTGAHVNPLWVMAYDVEPEVSIRKKEFFMKESVRHDWMMVLVHDPFNPVGNVRLEKEKFRYEPLPGIPHQSTDVGGVPFSLHNVQAPSLGK